MERSDENPQENVEGESLGADFHCTIFITGRHTAYWAWSWFSSVPGYTRKVPALFHALLPCISWERSAHHIEMAPSSYHNAARCAAPGNSRTLWDFPTVMRPSETHSRSCPPPSLRGKFWGMPQNLCSVYPLELHLTVAILPFPYTDGFTTQSYTVHSLGVHT